MIVLSNFEARKVAQGNTIRWRVRKAFVTSLLDYDYVGLEEVGEDLWSDFRRPAPPGGYPSARDALQPISPVVHPRGLFLLRPGPHGVRYTRAANLGEP